VNPQRSSWALLAALVLGASLAHAEDKSAVPAREPNFVFDQPAEKVQRAAVDALVVLGCEINKQEAAYVEGKRKRKIGAFVGSGGETLRVWLDAAQPDKTPVRVGTDKTFVGGAGQKNWDDEIIAEMKKALAAPTAETPTETPAAPEALTPPAT
jgi:hypothetical protein